MISDLINQRVAIDQQIAHEQHTQAMTAWEQTQQRAREAKRKLVTLRRAFREAEAVWARYEQECEQVRLEIENHAAQRPDPDDYPTEAELEAWQVEHQRLTTLLCVTMRARRLDLASIKERARMDMLTAEQEYEQLAYAERNARTKVQGPQ
jgi:hypothetical protein